MEMGSTKRAALEAGADFASPADRHRAFISESQGKGMMDQVLAVDH
jgi:hypothetical protein